MFILHIKCKANRKCPSCMSVVHDRAFPGQRYCVSIDEPNRHIFQEKNVFCSHMDKIGHVNVIMYIIINTQYINHKHSHGFPLV